MSKPFKDLVEALGEYQVAVDLLTSGARKLPGCITALGMDPLQMAAFAEAINAHVAAEEVTEKPKSPKRKKAPQPSSPMTLRVELAERRAKVAATVRLHPEGVKVADLAQILRMPDYAVRRDCEVLEKKNLVRSETYINSRGTTAYRYFPVEPVVEEETPKNNGAPLNVTSVPWISAVG